MARKPRPDCPNCGHSRWTYRLSQHYWACQRCHATWATNAYQNRPQTYHVETRPRYSVSKRGLTLVEAQHKARKYNSTHFPQAHVVKDAS
jgi:hypothetical protein